MHHAQAVKSNGAANGICNENLPNDGVYHRFLYVISALAANGFYIVVDNHIVVDSSYQNPGQWAALWAQARPSLLERAIRARHAVRQTLMCYQAGHALCSGVICATHARRLSQRAA